MVTYDRVLAVVTARGGSKGLPGKNILPLGGVPLIGWTLAAARASSLLTRTVVSTDDAQIADVAKTLGGDVPFLRPADIAGDSARVEAALLHAVAATGGSWDYVVLLQPTSPFRTGEDIDGCIRLCLETGAPSAVSFCEPSKSPYWMYMKDAEGRMVPLHPGGTTKRRQDLPQAFVPNGMIYVSTLANLRERQSFYVDGMAGYVMDGGRAVDVDSRADLDYAEWLVGRNGWKPGDPFVEKER